MRNSCLQQKKRLLEEAVLHQMVIGRKGRPNGEEDVTQQLGHPEAYLQRNLLLYDI